MKTPDEIKKGLEHCSSKNPCPDCPMWDECKGELGLKALLGNALALIRQLEAERDAAVKDIERASRCHACRKFFQNGGSCSGGTFCIPLRFEWRGVQKEDEKT